MGVLEWIGAHLLGPFIGLYRAIMARPRPEIRIVELEPTGGGTFVDFVAGVQNFGTKPARMIVSARVGEHDVTASPESPNLLVNTPPTRVFIWVSRPELGDLMKECNDAPTLYDETLHFRVDADGHDAEERWHEPLYDPEIDRKSYEIQQRYWRRGRGEETEADVRAELQSELLRRYDERMERGE